MKTRTGLWSCAVVLLAAAASPSQAAWCNVMEVCFHRNSPATSHYCAPPCTSCAPPCTSCAPSCTSCAPPCQQSCCTQYQARCYYEPVTSYTTKTYFEPVTSYRTSYYYEPVTSYRTSYYYDPCNCSYTARSCPVTSYQLRAQVCPVQSWVQRCASVPVTTYRQSFYWEPVPSCSSPAPAASCPTCPTSQPGVSVSPAAPTQPGVNVYPSGNPAGTLPETSAPPGSSDPGSRQVLPRGAEGANPSSGSPGVRLDRVVALPTSNVDGQVVRSDYTPQAETDIVFVNADQKGVEHRVTTNRDGEFRATLASGNWKVYVQGRDGERQLQKQIQVGEKNQLVTLLSK
jgi:hypothetical protein